MELWIRSQDKTILSKVQNIIIRENQNENNETNYAIVDIYIMGIYETKERALEVLDEIQNLLKPKLITKFESNVKYDENGTPIDILIPYDAFEKSEIQELSTYIYEMPKD